MSRIGFIGTGHIAAPMARTVAAAGHSVLVSDRNASIARGLAVHPLIDIAANQDVLDRSDIVFLCLRPAIAEEVLAGLAFRADHQIVSVMAGVSAGRLGEICAPAGQITLTIPVGFLEHGGCPLAAHPDAGPLASLFEPANPVIPIASEAAFNQHFAAATMLPGVLEMLAKGASWLGEKTGDPASAERYVTQLVAGFLASLPSDGKGRLTAERDAFATAGTISLQMVETLRQQGATDALGEALARIGARMEGRT